MRTNHVMVPDSNGNIYCRKLDKITKFKEGFFTKYCRTCIYLNGLGAGIGAIECKYDDGSNKINIVVEDPKQAKKIPRVIIKLKRKA